jgi:hypothetical protein
MRETEGTEQNRTTVGSASPRREGSTTTRVRKSSSSGLDPRYKCVEGGSRLSMVFGVPVTAQRVRVTGTGN